MASARTDGKRTTLAQVAKLAGVSVMTASYTYNRPDRVSAQARTKVLEAAARLGYAGPDASARSLRRGRTSSLGVVFGEHLEYAFDDPGAVSFLAGMAEVCREHGYGLTILPVTGTEADAARVTDAAVDGFVVWTTLDGSPVVEAVLATRRPAVVHGGPTVSGMPSVSIDNRAAARAIGALAFAGARRPAVLSLPTTRERIARVVPAPEVGTVTFAVTRHRLEGYREAAADAGMPWDDVVVAVCSVNDADEAYEQARALLAGPARPDAIAAMSDQLAVGVMRALQEAGLSAPGDVAVTGWDDQPVAAELGLTTVAQSLREQGAMCARAALGEEIPSEGAPWSLVRRRSTRSS